MEINLTINYKIFNSFAYTFKLITFYNLQIFQN